MASSFSSYQPRYQVFLSFRGRDTRHNFTNHLLEAMKDRGVDVFFDQEKLEKGDELPQALLNAIAASKISIIILSKNYASSKFCLRELSKIMECKSAVGQDVLPVFYRINPSAVRKLTGGFKKSFNQHVIEKPEQVERWKTAFTQVGYLNGWHIVGGVHDRSETEYIKDIVEVVIEKLSCKSTRVSKKLNGIMYQEKELVGIDDQKEKILSLIKQEHIRVIGIWGMGGIGKTTLAEAVYNEALSHSEFDAHHFLQDVRERSLEKYGMQSLQNELLSKVLKGDIHIDTRFIGSPLIQDRLRNIRVFVVLDDVNNLDQIERLGVEHFGPGSKIIVTSRDRQVLTNIGVDELHRVKELNKEDSVQLFCKFALRQYNLVADLRDLAMEFVAYGGGNPLALKVLGAALYQKTRDEWESALDKLKEYPEQEIFGPLKISFDGLSDLEKNIFLDIACFLKEENRNDVTNLLKGCYKGAKFGISSLIDKCLVDDRYDDLEMHDLLQEMGRDIVRQESKDPGRRSRLWSPEDVYHVLKNNKGTESIRGLSLDMSQIDTLIEICPTAFEKMVNLGFIRFQNRRYNMKGHNKLVVANQDLTYLPDALRYFHWDDCPLKCLPSNFSANKLVELRLPNSNVEQLWDGNQDIVNLRLMDLRWCKNIRKVPSLLGATKLETLLCGGCESLLELPCMTHLTSLKHLHLSGCPIIKFPEIPTNLEELFLPDTQIEELPCWSIGSLKKLYSLHMGGTKIQSISSSIVKLDALEYINLNMTPIEEVPTSISRLQSLKELHVRSCKSLKSLSELPPWLEVLDAENCTSLERVSFADHEYVRELNCITQFRFRNCFNLNQAARDNIIAAYPMIISKSIAKQSAKQLTKKLDENDEEELHEVLYYLPGSEISDKFKNQGRESSITVMLRPASSRTERFLCFALCLVFDFEHLPANDNRLYSIHCEYKLKDTGGCYQNFKREWDPIYCEAKPVLPGRSGEHVFVLFRQDMVHSDKHYVEAAFKFYVVCQYFHDNNFHNRGKKKMEVKKCGVHVFYMDSENFAVSHNVDSCKNFMSDEDNRCSPKLLSVGGLYANVKNGNGKDPANTITRFDCERSFSSGMRQSQPGFLGGNTGYDQHNCICRGFSVLQSHQENESCESSTSTLTTDSERFEIAEASPDLRFLKGLQQLLSTPQLGIQQPLHMQQSSYNDMQLLQHQLMLQQLRGLPRKKQLQMYGGARQQNTSNQLFAIDEQSAVGQFSPIINGRHAHEAPGMFMNTVQRHMPPTTIGVSNRVVFPQDQGLAFCSMGLSSQQSDASLYGSPVASARSNMSQYSQQRISNHPVNLFTKAGCQTQKLTKKSSGTFFRDGHTVLQDQVYKSQGGLKSNPGFQAKNMFGPTSLGPNIESPNSPVSPNWFSLGGSEIEDGAVGNGHAATTISRPDPKRSFSSDDERDYEPKKRVKL